MSGHEGIWTEYRPTYADHWSACKRMGDLVRCKDCKSMQRDNDYCFCMLAARELESVDGFCAWGERRDA